MRKSSNHQNKPASQIYEGLIMDHLPVLIVLIDFPAGKIIYTNKMVKELIGFSSRDLLNKKWWQFFGDSNLQKTSFLNIVEKQKVHNFEKEIKTKNGLKKNLLWTAVFLSSSKNRNIIFYGLDITEKKELEEHLKLVQRLEAIGRLAGGIAHDFNNILTGMKGYLELMLLNQHNQTETEYLQNINNGLETAAKLTHQLLTFSRKQVVQPKVINLNEIIDNILKMLKRIVPENIRISFKKGPKLKNVNVDLSQMEQVILNLVINAQESIMHHNGQIILETKNIRLDHHYVSKHSMVIPGHYVLLSITDNGIGIAEEIRDKIFEPFFTTKKKGIGMGLATVYGIIKKHGGYIWVYSEKGRGSSFKIYLPVMEITKEVILHDKTKKLFSSLKGNGQQIMIVEDEAYVGRALSELLKKYGYQTHAFENPYDILNHIEQYKDIDLIISDIVMPDMSGTVFVETFIKFYPQTKFLFISGYPRQFLLNNELLLPHIDFIQKPFKMEDVLRRIKKILKAKI